MLHSYLQQLGLTFGQAVSQVGGVGGAGDMMKNDDDDGDECDLKVDDDGVVADDDDDDNNEGEKEVENSDGQYDDE